MVKPRDTVYNVEVCIHGGINKNYLKTIGVTNPNRIIDFSASLNPYGPPKFVLNALRNAVNEVNKYPDVEASELKKLIAETYDCKETEILVAGGVTELIQLCALVFVDKTSRVLIPKHTYGEYEVASKIMGARIKFIEMPALRLDAQLIADSLQKGCILFLCNPNNPTGQYLTEEKMRMIIDKADDVNALLIVDEAYVDFVDKTFPSEKFATKSDNFILLRSLTKAFTVPGIRLGYAIASENNINFLRKVKPPWTVSIFAQMVGLAALKNRWFVVKSRKMIERSKKFIATKLAVLPSDANFYLFHVGCAPTAVKKLLRHNILVRDCSSFALPEYIRFSVRTAEENKQLVEALLSLKKSSPFNCYTGNPPQILQWVD